MELSYIDVSFRYGVGDNPTEREIIRNVKMILSTPLGSCPLYREFGVSMQALDRPMEIAETVFGIVAVEAVERWEPRVEVESIKFQPETTGKLTAKVVIRYAE